MNTGYVLDAALLEAFAQGSNVVANVLASFDAAAVRLAVPTLALAVAESTLSAEQMTLLSAVVANMPTIARDPLDTLDQVGALAHTLAWLPATAGVTAVSAAHVATVAKRLGWWVLTVDRASWDDILPTLPWPLEIVELAEPPNA